MNSPVRFYKAFLFFTVSILFSASALSQFNITGKVVSDLQIISGATVTLRSASDSSLIRGTVSDSLGVFTLSNISEGNFSLQVSAIGYLNASISVSIPSKDASLLTVLLTADTTIKQLEAVTIVAKKPFIVRKIDKTVVNIQGSIYERGEDAFQLFNVVPGIQTDFQGGINYGGTQQVTVYVNNRKVLLNGRELMAYLKSIPSESILSYDIINAAGSQYDAQNTGIVVNISLKKNVKSGFSGSVSSELTVYKRPNVNKILDPSTNNSLNLNYGVGKFSFQGSFTHGYGNSFQDNVEQQIYKNQPLKTVQDQKYTYVYPSNHYLLGFDYRLTDKHTIGATYQQSSYNSTLTGDSYLSFYNGASVDNRDSLFNTTNKSGMKNKNGNLVLFYTGIIDSFGSKFDVAYNRIDYTNRSSSDVITDYYINSTAPSYKTTYLYLNSPVKISVNIFNADLQKNVAKKIVVKAGAKWSQTQSDNVSNYYNGEERTWDEPRSTDFFYKENVLAFYGNLTKEWKGFSIQGGLRTEHTSYSGMSSNGDNKIGRDYWSLFPSVFLQRRFGEGARSNTLTLSYNRNINRPSYQSLNPFEIVGDPYYSYKGNPQLQPYFGNRITLSYFLLSNFDFAVSYSNTKNSIAYNYILDGERVITTFANASNNNSIGASVNGTVTIKKWLQFRPFASLFYNDIDVFLPSIRKVTKWTPNFSGTLTVTLPHKYYIDVTGFYLGHSFIGVYDSRPQGKINIAAKKSFFSDRLTTRLTVGDPFNLYKRIRYDVTETNFDRHVSQYYPARFVQVGLSYNFSKGKNTGRRQVDDAAQTEKGRL